MKKIIFSIFILSATAQAQWQSGGEVGMTLVGGNTETQTYNAAYKTSYAWDGNKVLVNSRFLRATSNGLESARNWDLGIRGERQLTERFGAYIGHSLESDIFSGYVQRNNYDLGGKYSLVKTDETSWSVEAGYRSSFTMFIGTSALVSNYLRTYTEVTQVLTPGATAKFWIEYLPSFTDSNDYLLNFEPSLTTMLSKVFSLKTAYLYKYHNILPPGFRSKSDNYFTLSFVAAL